MAYLRMRDFWTLKPQEVMKNQKHLLECTDSEAKSLLVKVAATHAGVVNQNYRFYRPDRMQDAAHQWAPADGKGFAKPVLVEHDKKGEVLGRVRSARYVDESYKWNGSFPSIKDSIFYDKKVDLFKSVDWIVEHLMPIPDYSGLGYLELGLNITNPEAIRKVLADEYLTVSVGFQTGQAICSVCHQDWAIDDKCEHRPGTTDEESGKKVFLICGDFKYEELSFVNFPADPFAGKISKDALKDSLNRKFFMGMSHDKQKAFAAAAGMSMSDAKMDYDIQHVEDTVADTQVTPTAEELEVQAAIAEGDKKADCGCSAAAGTACSCETDWSKEQLSAEETEYFADEEGLYAEMTVEMDAALAAGELTDELVKDAKLSTEKRKSLGASTFCGPNRSFPVPDCAHVTAARRLIGRAKVGDSTKSKILACVSRKASSLGCGAGAKKDAVENPQVAEKPDTKQVQDSELKQFVDAAQLNDQAAEILGHYDGLHKNYKAADDDMKGRMRHLHYQVGEHWSSSNALEYAKSYVKAHVKDEVLIPTTELAAKDTAVATLTDEVKKATDSVVAAKATQSEMLKAVKKSLATQIVIYKSLTGHADYKDLDQAGKLAKVDELSKRHVTSLKDAVADVMAELKWTEKPAEAPAASTDKAEEPGKSVADNAQVSESVADTTVTETEAEKAKRLEAEDAVLRDRLSLMTAKERRIYLADLAFNDAKTVSSKK